MRGAARILGDGSIPPWTNISPWLRTRLLVDRCCTRRALLEMSGMFRGHTLLLSYMLVSSSSKIVRIASILVLVQTLYLKYYVWGDFVTSNVGIVLGCALALIVWWAQSQ